MTKSNSAPNANGVSLSAGPSIDPEAQWLNAKLIARPELKYDVRTDQNQTQVVIEDPVRGKFFQVGLDEYHLIASLNPEQTLGQIIESISPESQANQLSQTQAVQIAQWLVQNNLAFCPGIDNSKQLDAQARALNRAKMMGWLNPISFRFKLFNPNTPLSRIQPYTQWLFSGWFLTVWLLLGCYSLIVLASDWERMGSASAGILAGGSWIWLLLIWFVLKVVHEAAHGVACRRFGGEVTEAGVLLLLFTPMAYVNVTSMWRFASRWQRIVVAAAGMYVELFISFVSILIWHWYPGVVGKIAFDVFIMSSVTTILFNANPLMRFDGYFILSDLLGVPNLYTKGTKWFGNRLKCLYFGLPKAANLFAAHERKSVMIYGAMAYIWKFLICIGLIIGASVLFYGAGIAIAAVAAVLWFGIPLLKHSQALFGPNAIHQVNRRRLAFSSCVTLSAIAGLFFVLKAPAKKSAPAIVQFSHEQIVRAKSEGFIRSILVQNGQHVQQNQPIMVLENPDLAVKVEELKRLAEESKIEARLQRNLGEMALSQVAMEKHESHLQQLAEKQQQLDSLTVVAPIDGVVYERNLANRIGSYANLGDPLCSIARSDSKEVVVSIDQRDLESIEGNEGKSLQLVFPGHVAFESKLTRINPRATASPEFPSLCANAGGPLPIKPVAYAGRDEKQFELLIPRFSAELALEPAIGERLQSGQRGRAFFATSRHSLGSYLYVAVSDWLKNKIDVATSNAAF